MFSIECHHSLLSIPSVGTKSWEFVWRRGRHRRSHRHFRAFFLLQQMKNGGSVCYTGFCSTFLGEWEKRRQDNSYPTRTDPMARIVDFNFFFFFCINRRYPVGLCPIDSYPVLLISISLLGKEDSFSLCFVQFRQETRHDILFEYG